MYVWHLKFNKRYGNTSCHQSITCLISLDMGSDTEQSSLSPPKSKTETNNSARHAKQSSSLRRSYRTPKRRIVERERAVKITSTREDRRKKSELLKHSAEREQQERPSVQVLYFRAGYVHTVSASNLESRLLLEPKFCIALTLAITTQNGCLQSKIK